jgi:polyhydroxyalkanoate synthesis regulator phasin
MKASDLFYLGLGGAFMAKDRAEKILDEMEERGQISRDEANKVIDEAKERARKQQEELDQTIKKRVKESIQEYGLATKDDIEDLKQHISKEMDELKKLLKKS